MPPFGIHNNGIPSGFGHTTPQPTEPAQQRPQKPGLLRRLAIAAGLALDPSVSPQQRANGRDYVGATADVRAQRGFNGLAAGELGQGLSDPEHLAILQSVGNDPFA